MDVTAMSKMAYAMNQSAAKLPQTERVQTAQMPKGGAADAAKTAQDAGAAGQILEIHRTVFGQEAQDTPLLVGEADFVEQRAKMRHQRFARLY